MGRGRHGLRRPRRGGHARPVRRRPRPGHRRRGGEAGRRPAGHPPPALSARYDDGRGRHLQGPGRAHPDQERHRAARRAHQRRPRRPGSLRRPRGRARPAGRTPPGAGPDRPGRPPGPRPVCELDHPRAPSANSPRAPPSGCPPPRRASASRATPTPSSGPSRSAAAPATASSTRSGRRAWTPSSPPTCATTRPRRLAPHGTLALLDAAHWATEWPWCEQAAGQLDEISDRKGWALRVHVSRTVTDPWTIHAASTPASSGAPN